MRNVSVTRMALQARKNRIELARQGSEMLEQKRTALLQELMKVVDTVMEEATNLELVASEARRALARAEAMAGSEAFQSAAMAARGELPVRVATTDVMGVRVPEIEQKDATRSPLGRGYAVTGTSLAIDEAAQAFEEQVNVILQLAESELRLRRLADEIRHLTRRVNALEQILIPRLEDERDYIEMMLEERERSERYRLKLVKELINR